LIKIKLQQQPNGQFIVTLPKDIVMGFGWKKHEVLDFKIIGAGELKVFKRNF